MKAPSPLKRLVLEVRKASDTPDLISILSGDQELLRLVQRILNPPTLKNAGFLKEVERTCRQENITSHEVRRRLAPAAAALGLAGKSEECAEGFYDILNVPFNASSSVIRKAYRVRARQLHPDAQPDADPAHFSRLAEAYRVLSNPELRERYDRQRKENSCWFEQHRISPENTGLQKSWKQRQKRQAVFLMAGAAVLLLLLIGLAEHVFKNQALHRAQPVPKLSTTMKGLSPQIREFITSYCEAYESMNYDRLKNYFAPDAVENDRAVKDLQSQYLSVFDQLQDIVYDIEVKQHTIKNGLFEVTGNYVLNWRFRGSGWQEMRGPIFLALIPDGNFFRIKRLVYH